jgi:rod shape determining protein RodA
VLIRFSVFFLLLFSIVILHSIAPYLFPLYYLYLALGLVAFFFFSKMDFEVISLFSNHLYIMSVIFLILPFLIGQVTRGSVRWILLGALSVQPAEIVRPFLLVFFANYLTNGNLDLKRIIKALLLLSLPLFLILVQPSLGVTILTAIGFLGVLLASDFNKRYLLVGLAALVLILPVFWKILAPYQKSRIVSFINPSSDPLGSGYNSIQSMISVGSGKILGRGLGKGIQTQLAFLPERHTDFVFASISEELGFIGASLVLLAEFIILWRLITMIEKARSFSRRAYISGFFLIFLVQIIVNIGMNLGLLPITGVPLPLVSAGGSSLLATMIGLGIAIQVRKH